MSEDRPKLKWLDESCHVCGERLNSWDARVSKALGYHAKHCERCIAAEYDLTQEELRSRMEDFFGMLPCAGL